MVKYAEWAAPAGFWRYPSTSATKKAQKVYHDKLGFFAPFWRFLGLFVLKNGLQSSNTAVSEPVFSVFREICRCTFLCFLNSVIVDTVFLTFLTILSNKTALKPVDYFLLHKRAFICVRFSKTIFRVKKICYNTKVKIRKGGKSKCI